MHRDNLEMLDTLKDKSGIVMIVDCSGDYSVVNTPLRLTASFWKLFKIISFEILEAKFGISTQTLV